MSTSLTRLVYISDTGIVFLFYPLDSVYLMDIAKAEREVKISLPGLLEVQVHGSQTCVGWTQRLGRQEEGQCLCPQGPSIIKERSLSFWAVALVPSLRLTLLCPGFAFRGALPMGDKMALVLLPEEFQSPVDKDGISPLVSIWGHLTRLETCIHPNKNHKAMGEGRGFLQKEIILELTTEGQMGPEPRQEWLSTQWLIAKPSLKPKESC